MGVFAKIVKRNVETSNGIGDHFESGEVWIDFFSNPAGTIPIDVTGLSLTVNARERYFTFEIDGSNNTTNSDLTFNPTGTKIKIFEGTLYESHYDPSSGNDNGFEYSFTLQAGTGYTII